MIPIPKDKDYKHYGRQEAICFTTQGREICVPATKLEQLFKGRAREVSSWTVFKIMSEFIAGFDFLKKCKKSVSIMGGARVAEDKEIYKKATNLAFKLAKSGFAIITGGGPGIMEAANKGAYEAGGRSIGINIRLATEQRVNKYVKEYESFTFFFTRKVMLETSSSAYIFFPGGFGTLDEFFEMITLIQTHKIRPVPVILVGRQYWTPLLDWINTEVFARQKAISKQNMEIYHVVDNADQAFNLIKKLSKNKHLFD